MADDLRTRIAAAIYNASDEYTRKLMVRPDCPGASELEGCGKPVCYILADAVIRELEADYIRALLPQREGAWGWLDGTVSTNPKTGNPIKLEIEPGEVIPLTIDDARDVALALLSAVAECGSSDG